MYVEYEPRQEDGDILVSSDDTGGQTIQTSKLLKCTLSYY